MAESIINNSRDFCLFVCTFEVLTYEYFCYLNRKGDAFENAWKERREGGWTAGGCFLERGGKKHVGEKGYLYIKYIKQ